MTQFPVGCAVVGLLCIEMKKNNLYRKSGINCGVLYLLFMVVGCASDTANFDQHKALVANDPHSYANSDEVVIEHISLYLEVDFDATILRGTARLDIRQLVPSTQLIVDTKMLQVSDVFLDNGNCAKFTVGKANSIFGTPLIIPISSTTKSVTVHYTTSPKAEALQWLDASQTLGKQHPFLFTQSQAILARTWVPCQDSPGVKFTYDATIQTKPNLLALMSAQNGTQKNADGLYTFKMKQPISSYLLALAVGDLSYTATGRNSGVYAEPPMLEKAVWELASMQAMIDSAEVLYGPYAWEQYDVVILPPSFPFGGMENPRLTFATPTIIAGDRSLVSLIAHELAHSWSGNLVTNETWNDFWLNEGFTVYFEQRIMEKIFGKKYEEMLTTLGMGELKYTLAQLKAQGKEDDTHLYLNLAGRDPDDGLTDVAYEKGRFFLQSIEKLVGRQRFDVFLKKYFSENKFKTMSTSRFILYINEHLLTQNEQTQMHVNKWIYGPGLPDNMPLLHSAELDRVDSAITRYDNAIITAKSIDTTGYSTHHFLYFLRGLKKLNATRMKELDEAFGFTQTGNSEIACDWFKHAIKQEYKEAFPAMKVFLTSVGRRKFLAPLYSRLAETPENLKWAREVYAEARPLYHFVAYNAVDKIVE